MLRDGNKRRLVVRSRVDRAELVRAGGEAARDGGREDAVLRRVVEALEEGELGRVADGRRRERVDRLDDDVRVTCRKKRGELASLVSERKSQLTDDDAVLVDVLRGCASKAMRTISSRREAEPEGDERRTGEVVCRTTRVSTAKVSATGAGTFARLRSSHSAARSPAGERSEGQRRRGTRKGDGDAQSCP